MKAKRRTIAKRAATRRTLSSKEPFFEPIDPGEFDIVKLKLGPGGRLVIPARFRKKMGIKAGDEVMMRVVDGELQVWTYDNAVRRAQEWAARTIPKGVSLVKELLAERRREAAREDRGE